MRSRLVGTLSAGIILLTTATSAALVGTGGGLFYDDKLDITWAQPDIERTWDNANRWAAGLTLGGVSGWRLPYISVAAGAGPLWGVYPVDCNTANELDCRDNELGYMFYHNLSGTYGSSILSSGDPDLILFPTLESGYYWSGTEFDPFYAWSFVFSAGYQPWSGKGYKGFTWAVHPGYVVSTDPVDLNGTVQMADGPGLCAMVLASGRYMFSCNPNGPFSLTDLPRENDGTVKRQVYVDGFLPNTVVLQDSVSETVIMEHAGTCHNYNPPSEPGFFPDSAGKRINISGLVLLQDTQTPICAMVLANGQYMFSCDGTGSYALNIPLDNNGQFKLQVYADGFAPTIQTFDEFQAVNDVRMARAVECQ